MTTFAKSKVYVYNKDSSLHFGKYKGSTVGDVLKSDPSYIVWCFDNIKFFKVDYDLKVEIDSCREMVINSRRSYIVPFNPTDYPDWYDGSWGSDFF